MRKYNITKHRATNTSPFLLFHGQEGFNSSILNPIDGEDEQIEESGNDVSYSRWIFNNSSEVENQLINEINLNSTNENQSPNETNTQSMDLINSTLEHFERYRNSMILQANPNTVSRRIEVGDIVMIKMDFDNNSQNRRMPFDSFFESNRFTVLELLDNNMLKLKDNSTQEIRNVFKNRLRKLSE